MIGRERELLWHFLSAARAAINVHEPAMQATEEVAKLSDPEISAAEKVERRMWPVARLERYLQEAEAQAGAFESPEASGEQVPDSFTLVRDVVLGMQLEVLLDIRGLLERLVEQREEEE